MGINSLFNEQSRNIAKKHNTITIGGISGQLLGGLNMSIEQEWENLLAFRDNFALLQKGMNSVGSGLFNAGFWTEKIFRGGGYLVLAPRFRVYDENYNGRPLASVRAFEKFLLPKYDGLQYLSDAYTAIEAMGRDLITSNPNSVVLEQNSAAADATHTVNGRRKVATIGPDGKQIGRSFVSNGVNSNISRDAVINQDLANLSFNMTELIKNTKTISPIPVDVTACGFFNKQKMIVTSLSFECSTEMTTHGPLFIDFNVTLSSLTALSRSPTTPNGILSGGESTFRTDDPNDKVELPFKVTPLKDLKMINLPPNYKPTPSSNSVDVLGNLISKGKK